MKLPEGYEAGVAPKKPTAMGGVGQQLMEKMGWTKGQGLGKESQGRAKHIEVDLKNDKAGLGGKYTWDWAENYAAAAFESAISKIKHDSGESSDSSDSSDSDSDDEALVNRDGTAANASASELRLGRELAKDNNFGRFGSRSGKVARLREQESLLVGDAGGAKPCAHKRPRDGASERAPALKRKMIIIEIKAKGLEDRSQPAGPPPPMPDNWWGTKVFASAGWLGGLGDDESTRTRQEFTEDTQEGIYHRLKAQQATGRKGMGKREVKVMGTKWEGSKTTFVDDEAAAAPSGASEDSCVPVTSEVAAASGAASGPGSGADSVKTACKTVKKKWKSAAEGAKATFLSATKQCLEQAKGGRLKRAKLETRLVDLLGLSVTDVQSKLQKRLQSGKLKEGNGRLWIA